jgi:glycosyltransferase involved in cell wall biosynthesis
VLNGAAGDVRRLYNGIDLDAFTPAPHVERDPALILSVGRLVEKKGFEDLIRACALLRQAGVEARCEIIGAGERREALQALIDTLDLGQQVRLVGPKPQDEVMAAYRRAAVFALPCVVAEDGNRDGLPTVLLEAMASGLPVVSTNLVGVPEIVDDGVNGLLVEPGDVAGLAAQLARLLRDAGLRHRLGEAGRRKVAERFDVRQNVAQLHNWLAGAASGNGHRPPEAHSQAGAMGASGAAFAELALAPAPSLREALPAL